MLKEHMQTVCKKNILLFLFLFCIKTFYSYAEVENPPNKGPPIAEKLVFQNYSILKCGSISDDTVFTLLDVQVLLSVSNILLKPIELTTDWSHMNNHKINAYKNSNKTPQDILRVLLLCLNWQDVKSTNLFSVSDSELENYLALMKEEQPWKIYPQETQNKINSLSDNSLKELILIVLKAKLSEPVRGGLKSNQLLKMIKYTWLLSA